MATQRGLWPAAAWVIVSVIAVAGARAQEPQPEQPAADEGKDWSVEVDLALNSHYVWRGIHFTDDPVFQPSVTFAWTGLSLTFSF